MEMEMKMKMRATNTILTCSFAEVVTNSKDNGVDLVGISGAQ